MLHHYRKRTRRKDVADIPNNSKTNSFSLARTAGCVEITICTIKSQKFILKRKYCQRFVCLKRDYRKRLSALKVAVADGFVL